MTPATPPDPNMIEAVVRAMLEGIIISGLRPSSSEMLSACFTLTKRTIAAVVRLSPDEASRLHNLDAASNALMQLFPENKVM